MSDRTRDIGILIIRIGIGAMFMMHGWPKLTGGLRTWKKLGGAMRHVGIDLWPEFWGFMAAISECGGGLLLAVGLLFRPASACLLATMIVAASMHLGSGDSLMKSSHAIEAAFVFLGLLLIGPGRYAIEVRFKSGQRD